MAADRFHRIVGRTGRVAIALAPAPFRDRWRVEAEATFVATCSAAYDYGGALRFARVGSSELFDLLRSALRLRAGQRQPITGGYTPRSPRKTGSSMQSVWDDFVGGWRALMRRPRAALGAIGLLALAIGVTSAMFAIVDAFMLRPAPFREVETLSELQVARPTTGPRAALPAARTLRDSSVFASVLPTVINAPGEFKNAPGQRHMGAWIQAGTFATLGVSPILGREFVPGEGQEGHSDQVLLSEAVWRTVFNADPSIAGKIVEMNGVATTVVGVMPDWVRFPLRGDAVWRPLDIDRPSREAQANQAILFARRQAGMPPADAEQLATQALGRAVTLRPFSRTRLDDYSTESIVSLSIGVGLVFVLLCANVTNLILARTSTRRSEFGVCSALGASRVRLLRQVLLEQLPIGVCATALGLVLAYSLVALAQQTLPEDVLWRTLNKLDLDWRAVAATSGAGFLAIVLAGLPAAWLGTRTNANEVIAQQSRGGTDSASTRRLTRGLLVLEVAMAVAVLASAGLHVRSFVNLVGADRGLDSHRVLIAEVATPQANAAAGIDVGVTGGAIEARLTALPGVERVNRATDLPPDSGAIHFGAKVQTDVTGAPPVSTEFLRSYNVSPGFFETFGVDLLDGRGLQPGDDRFSVVISQGFSRQLFGDVSPVGHTLTLWNQTYRVVGLAEEVRNSLFDPREDHPELYLMTPPASTANALTFGLRCVDRCPSIESVRQAITTTAALTVRSVRPLSDDFMDQLERPKTAAVIAAGFAGLALIATAAGLYGVLAYAVSRRRREFGIRAALGADLGSLRRLILNDGLRVTAMGLVVGLGAGWALGRWLESVRFGVTFLDPLTWTVVASVVTAVALMASWRPARSATRVDPVEMLREP